MGLYQSISLDIHTQHEGKKTMSVIFPLETKLRAN